MSSEIDDASELIPSPLVTTGLYTAAAAVAGAFVVQITSSQTLNGQVVQFRDWGAVSLGAVALLAALGSIPVALSALAPQHRSKRLAIIAGISVVALYRVVYGLGLLV